MGPEQALSLANHVFFAAQDLVWKAREIWAYAPTIGAAEASPLALRLLEVTRRLRVISEEESSQLPDEEQRLLRALRRQVQPLSGRQGVEILEAIPEIEPIVRDWFSRPTDSGNGKAEQRKPRRKRSTKRDTKVKTYAAIAWKMKNPHATSEECAAEVDIPRTTLVGRPEWIEWCPRIETAADRGSLEAVKAELDKRIGRSIPSTE